jgi:hypothetical protein
LIASSPRPDADTIVITITDGADAREDLTASFAQNLRNDGVKMFALGVGNVKWSGLTDIAGPNSFLVC